MISQHAIDRFKSRATPNAKYTLIRSTADMALKNGLSVSDFKKKAQRKYLLRKIHSNRFLKVYLGYIFIYSKTGYLITLYKAPEWLLKKR